MAPEFLAQQLVRSRIARKVVNKRKLVRRPGRITGSEAATTRAYARHCSDRELLRT